MDNISIKDNIRKFRKSRGLTQEEMAHRVGISLTAYRDIERGKTAILNTHVEELAEHLEISPEEIVLGYRPVQMPGKALNEVQEEHRLQISTLEKESKISKSLSKVLRKTYKARMKSYPC